MSKIGTIALRLLVASACAFCTHGIAQNNPTANGHSSAPDDWLLAKRGE